MKLAICCMIGLASLVSRAHGDVVQVQSEYADQSAPHRRLKVTGQGFLFSYGQRFFVFTASHLSQGQSLHIDSGGRPLNVIRSLRDDQSDLELFEVALAVGSESMATYRDGQFIFEASTLNRRRWLDDHNYVPLVSGVQDPNLETDNRWTRSRTNAVSLNVLGDSLFSEALLEPGTTGAPLLSLIPDPGTWPEGSLPYDVRENLDSALAGKTVVRGLFVRRDRFFSRVHFVPRNRLVHLLNRFLAHDEAQPESEWRASGTLLYRIYSGFTETASWLANYAGPLVQGGGNSSSVEGGDLTSLGEDTPGLTLANLSMLPLRGGEAQFYYNVHLRPTIWAWFDLESFSHLRKLGFGERRREWDVTGDLLTRLGERLGRTTGDVELQMPAYLRLTNSGLIVRFSLDGGDELQFKLNRSGVLCLDDTCQSRFQTVIEAPSRKGRVYLIDLRELFFSNPSTLALPALRARGAERLSADEVAEASAKQIQSDLGHPRLRYRPKRAKFSQPMTVEEGLPQTVQW